MRIFRGVCRRTVRAQESSSLRGEGTAVAGGLRSWGMLGKLRFRNMLGFDGGKVASMASFGLLWEAS